MQDPGSPFTHALAVMRHNTDGYVALQNDRLRQVTATGVHETVVSSADHLAEIFETVFDLDVPDAGKVWARVQAIGQDRAA